MSGPSTIIMETANKLSVELDRELKKAAEEKSPNAPVVFEWVSAVLWKCPDLATDSAAIYIRNNLMGSIASAIALAYDKRNGAFIGRLMDCVIQSGSLQMIDSMQVPLQSVMQEVPPPPPEILALLSKETYTTGDAALLCKVSQQTIIRQFDSGQLEGFHVPNSKYRRIPRENLIKYMQARNLPIPAGLIGGPSDNAEICKIIRDIAKTSGYTVLKAIAEPPVGKPNMQFSPSDFKVLLGQSVHTI